jgi:hypothetical protein
VGQPATIERSRPVQAHQRNLLTDFDALLERAMVAAEEGREQASGPFADEALRIAGDLTLCGEAEHQHKPLEPVVLRRFILLALAAAADAELEKAQIYARSAKGYLRGRVCQKTGPSLSGRPVW